MLHPGSPRPYVDERAREIERWDNQQTKANCSGQALPHRPEQVSMKARPIDEIFSFLDKNIGLLDEAIGSLSNDLAPVLGPKKENSCVAPDKGPCESYSPVIETLGSFNLRIMRVLDELVMIKARLEI